MPDASFVSCTSSKPGIANFLSRSWRISSSLAISFPNETQFGFLTDLYNEACRLTDLASSYDEE